MDIYTCENVFDIDENVNYTRENASDTREMDIYIHENEYDICEMNIYIRESVINMGENASPCSVYLFYHESTLPSV